MLRSGFGREPGLCGYCNAEYTNLDEHWKRVHQRTCRIALGGSQRHITLRRQSNGLFYCPRCVVSFEFSDLLRAHINWSCPIQPAGTDKVQGAQLAEDEAPTSSATLPSTAWQDNGMMEMMPVIADNLSQRLDATSEPSGELQYPDWDYSAWGEPLNTSTTSRNDPTKIGSCSFEVPVRRLAGPDDSQNREGSEASQQSTASSDTARDLAQRTALCETTGLQLPTPSTITVSSPPPTGSPPSQAPGPVTTLEPKREVIDLCDEFITASAFPDELSSLLSDISDLSRVQRLAAALRSTGFTSKEDLDALSRTPELWQMMWQRMEHKPIDLSLADFVVIVDRLKRRAADQRGA